MKTQWTIREDGGVFDIMDESGAFATCDNLAKAHLIATAPELLASLKELYELLEDKMPSWYLNGHGKRAEQAIAKAEGK